jgi:hypothetical protein
MRTTKSSNLGVRASAKALRRGCSIVVAGLFCLLAWPAASRAQQDAAKPADPPKVFFTFRPGPSQAEGLSFSGGTGLIRGVTPDTLRPGKWAIGALEMNFDRNPGDIDFFQYSFQFAIGVTKRTEVFVSGMPVLRTNAVNLDAVDYPVPPLDLFIDTYPTVANRSQPYFLFPPDVPYKTYNIPTVHLNPPSHGVFSHAPGPFMVGGKVNVLSEKRGDRLGLAVQGYVEIPTEHPVGNTMKGTTLNGVPGTVNTGFRVAVAKRLKGAQVLGNVGYKWAGTPSLGGMRIQYVDSSRVGTSGFLVGAPVNIPLKLYDELSFTAGTRVPIFNIVGNQSWFIAEFTYTRYVGSGISLQRLIHPAEVRVGVQGEIPTSRGLMIGVAWQYPLNNAGDLGTRFSNFVSPDGKGDINFGELVDPQLASVVGAYFAQNGVTLPAYTSKMFATNNAAFDGWRNVKTGPQPVTAQGNNAIVAFISWQFR